MEVHVLRYPRLTSALEGSGWSKDTLLLLAPGKELLCQLYRRMSGPQDQSGRVYRISTSPLARTPKHPARNVSQSRPSWRKLVV